MSEKQSISDLKSMCRGMDIKLEDDVVEYLSNCIQDSYEAQEALSKLKVHSTLMHMDIDLETAKNLLDIKLSDNSEVHKTRKLVEINDLSFKYLFDDKDHDEHYSYVLVIESVIYPSDDIIVFKVENKNINETYEMKLIYIDGIFYIVSEFLDAQDIKHELKYFKNGADIILYKEYSDGEMYLHIDTK